MQFDASHRSAMNDEVAGGVKGARVARWASASSSDGGSGPPGGPSTVTTLSAVPTARARSPGHKRRAASPSSTTTSGVSSISPQSAFLTAISVAVINATAAAAQGNDGGSSQSSPNTGLAMIILYAITGAVTFMFLIVIMSGAVRAIRHPERYGPRAIDPHNPNGPGIAQSRAHGLTRAILDTFPVVKFGRSTEEGIPPPGPAAAQDVEAGSAAGSKHGGEEIELEAMGNKKPAIVLDDDEDEDEDEDDVGSKKAVVPVPVQVDSPRSTRPSRELDRGDGASSFVSADEGASVMMDAAERQFTPSPDVQLHQKGKGAVLDDAGTSASAAASTSASPILTTASPLPAAAAGDSQRTPRPEPLTIPDLTGSPSSTSPSTALPADTTDPTAVDNAVTCPICVDAFEDGDDLRILPCDGRHRFHRDCIDPWLLNVSSLCPLCRLDLSVGRGEASTDSSNPAPLAVRGPESPRAFALMAAEIPPRSPLSSRPLSTHLVRLLGRRQSSQPEGALEVAEGTGPAEPAGEAADIAPEAGPSNAQVPGAEGFSPGRFRRYIVAVRRGRRGGDRNRRSMAVSAVEHAVNAPATPHPGP